jgi:hypothetical protein
LLEVIRYQQAAACLVSHKTKFKEGKAQVEADGVDIGIVEIIGFPEFVDTSVQVKEGD